MPDLEWTSSLVLLEAVAAVSEGFCPKCAGRLSQIVPFDGDIEPTSQKPFARGGCTTCEHWLEAGPNGAIQGLDWFSVTMLNSKSGGAVLTLMFNPPRSEEDYWEDEEEWEVEEGEVRG